MSSFTAWVWIGIVMISITSSTSMTSISGVVLISIITSSSSPLPTFIAIVIFLANSSRRDLLPVGFGNEGDLLNATALAIDNHLADKLEARILVAPHMDF